MCSGTPPLLHRPRPSWPSARPCRPTPSSGATPSAWAKLSKSSFRLAPVTHAPSLPGGLAALLPTTPTRAFRTDISGQGPPLSPQLPGVSSGPSRKGVEGRVSWAPHLGPGVSSSLGTSPAPPGHSLPLLGSSSKGAIPGGSRRQTDRHRAAGRLKCFNDMGSEPWASSSLGCDLQGPGLRAPPAHSTPGETGLKPAQTKLLPALRRAERAGLGWG